MKSIAVGWANGVRQVFDDQNTLTAYLVANAGRRVTLRIQPDAPGPERESLMRWRPEDEPLSVMERVDHAARQRGCTDAAVAIARALLLPVQHAATDVSIATSVYNRGLDLAWTIGGKRHDVFIGDGAITSYKIVEAT